MRGYLTLVRRELGGYFISVSGTSDGSVLSNWARIAKLPPMRSIVALSST